MRTWSFCLALLSLALLSLPSPVAGQYAPGRGPDHAPKAGVDAPKVSAVTPDGKVIDLSKPPRTTVLVFGSHT